MIDKIKTTWKIIEICLLLLVGIGFAYSVGYQMAANF